MQHLTDGEIRAYQDQELEPPLLRQAEAHLTSCPQCQAQAAVLLEKAQQVQSRLAALSPGHLQAPASPTDARLRLERLIQTPKEHEPMLNRLFSRQSRPAWAVLAVVALLVVSMAFAPVRALANSFLGLFRVQQITVVPVNPGNLPEQLGSSIQLEAMLTQDVVYDKVGEHQTVANAKEASELAGFQVRLPTDVEDMSKLEVQPGGNMVFDVQMAHLKALLAEIDRSDIQLPEGLDGARVTIAVPMSVMAQFGPCTYDPYQSRDYDPDEPGNFHTPDCTTLIQMPSPTISAPAGLDLNQIGEAFLQLLGLEREEAAHFAQNVDWATTFILPIPRSGVTYYDVPIDGVTGTLIQSEKQRVPSDYMLMWVKDGIVYALTGPGGRTAAISIAESLE